MTANFAKHQETPIMQVGFIGLGTMGASMASNLQKAGYKLVVHDVRRQHAGVHLAAGAQWADSPQDHPARHHMISTSQSRSSRHSAADQTAQH